MLAREYSDRTLSLALVISSAAWGLYWYPLRAIEETGFAGGWSVVFFNACPLLVLLPLLLTHLKQLRGILWPTLLAGTMIGFAFTLYANSLVETTVVRATLLFYLTPVWSTLIGVLWLSEKLTRARVLAISVGLVGLFLLLSDAESAAHPLNIGDLYGMLSGMFWAVCAATLNRWPGIPIMPLTTLSFILTAALSIVFAAAIRGRGIAGAVDDRRGVSHRRVLVHLRHPAQFFRNLPGVAGIVSRARRYPDDVGSDRRHRQCLAADSRGDDAVAAMDGRRGDRGRRTDRGVIRLQQSRRRHRARRRPAASGNLSSYRPGPDAGTLRNRSAARVTSPDPEVPGSGPSDQKRGVTSDMSTIWRSTLSSLSSETASSHMIS